MEQETVKLSFIIVNFESRKLLLKSLSSIRNYAPSDSEIIVVNNDPAKLEITFPGLKIINSFENNGFGAGTNLGARVASGQYLFFLNPDAELSSPVDLALEELVQNPGVAILGAKLVDQSGQIESWSAGKKINLWRLLINNIGLGTQNALLNSSQNKLVDWVSGAAMIVRKDFFLALGGFDEKFFMYFEDMDLCLRAQKKGSDVLYFPSLVVRHLGGQSFSGKEAQKEYFYASQQYYFQKHFSKIHSWIVAFLKIVFHS